MLKVVRSYQYKINAAGISSSSPVASRRLVSSKAVIRLRKMDAADRHEQDEIMAIYMRALGMVI